MIPRQKLKHKTTKVGLKSQVFLDRDSSRRSAVYLKIAYDILVYLFIIVVFYVLFFSSFMQISIIKINGNTEIATADILNEVNIKASGKYVKIFPKSNFLSFPVGDVAGVLKDKFKKISNVKVSKVFPSTVVIDIVERKSLLVWCELDNCYMVDEKGIAYAHADMSSSEIQQNHLVKIIDTSGQSMQMGDSFLDNNYMKFILKMKDELKNKLKIEINDEYVTPSIVSEEVNVTTNNGTRLIFSSQFDFDIAMKSLELLIEKKKFSDSDMQQIEYIDLRSENKVFYKMRNVEPVIENTEEANVEIKKDEKK